MFYYFLLEFHPLIFAVFKIASNIRVMINKKGVLTKTPFYSKLLKIKTRVLILHSINVNFRGELLIIFRNNAYAIYTGSNI